MLTIIGRYIWDDKKCDLVNPVVYLLLVEDIFDITEKSGLVSPLVYLI